MRNAGLVAAVALFVALDVGAAARLGAQSSAKPAAAKTSEAELDGLMAPVALYPDQLLSQMLLCAGSPPRVSELHAFLKTNPPFTGTTLQDVTRQKGFEPSFVAIVLFPQVVAFMATNLEWTAAVGQVFASDRKGVLASVQRLRADSLAAGKLKNTEQQKIRVIQTEAGEKVIVIEPANPQVVYVPQYNTQTVYTTAPTSTTVVVQQESSSNDAAVAAGVIGFTAGVVIGAAMSNDYYYGPHGWHGGPYMYNDAWDDFYDDREDAREDWYDNREDAREDYRENREDLSESRNERASNAQEQRTDRTQSRQEGKTDRSQNRQGTGTQAASTQAASTQAARTQSRERSTASSYEASGRNRASASTASERSGTRSDAFSNYSSGKSERAAKSRGQRSRSGGGGGGGRRR